MQNHKTSRLAAIIGLLFVAALFTCSLQAQTPVGGGSVVQPAPLIPLTPEDQAANLRLQTKRLLNQSFNANQQQYRQLQQVLAQPNAQQQLGDDLFNLVKAISEQLKAALNKAKPGTIPD